MPYMYILGLGLGWSLGSCVVGLTTIDNLRWQRIAITNLTLGFLALCVAAVGLVR